MAGKKSTAAKSVDKIASQGGTTPLERLRARLGEIPEDDHRAYLNGAYEAATEEAQRSMRVLLPLLGDLPGFDSPLAEVLPSTMTALTALYRLHSVGTLVQELERRAS